MTVTNREYAEHDELFKIAVALAFGDDHKPTKRQASKFRRGYGKAAQLIPDARLEFQKRREIPKTAAAEVAA